MMPTRPSVRESLTGSESEWLRVRAFLDDNRFELGKEATAQYPDHLRIGPTPLLTSERWLPHHPLPLRAVHLELESNWQPPSSFRDTAPAVVLPRRADGSRYESYSEAITELTGRKVKNRSTYRLRGKELREDPRLGFDVGRYFDLLDSGEAAAHEFAATRLGLLPASDQIIRQTVGDPCDFSRRATHVAISALTLRHDPASGRASYLLHWRDPAKVGHAGGLYQVLPTGVFQAAGEAAWNLRNDFDLWRSMIREYAEELLGQSEDYNAEQSPIDYGAWPFAAAMARGLDDGTIRVYVLGLGVDPLTLATDLLTVAVIDAEVYDELFDGTIAVNEEGRVLTAPASESGPGCGIPFTAETVARFVADEPMQAAGAAVLWSAWEHRAALLG